MGYKTITATEALKALGAQLKGVTVQVAKPVKVKGEDGVERAGFETKKEPISEKHVLSAKKWDNGQVTVTTIDGKRYPEGVNVNAAREDAEAAA